MGLFWSLAFNIIFCFHIDSSKTDAQKTQTFIVRVENNLKPSEYFDVEQWYSSILKDLSSIHVATKAQTVNDFLYVYKTVFHGFSTKLTPQQAQELKKRPEILGVFPDRLLTMQITRSPEFLGLITGSGLNSLSNESEYGANVIIGMLDSGIWPERRSFNDEGLESIPSSWKGECQGGETFPKTLCNKKIIGVRYFSNGIGHDNTTLKSARDIEGHGTHTASTAAGRTVYNASFLGYAQGNAVGIAPKARLAVYKVCFETCTSANILAGFDKAVEDGVHIISLSIGSDGAVALYEDVIAIGSFGAMEKGVIVSTSAGNSGPSIGTVTNVAPWVITVGAGTIDRRFPTDLLLGDGHVITGTSLYSGKPLPRKAYLPLIYAGKASVGGYGAYCYPGSLIKKLVRGKIVVCDRGGMSRVYKGLVVKKAGGVGVVVANLEIFGAGLTSDAHLIPGLAINESARHLLLDYITTSKNPRARMVFRGTQLGVKPAPLVASFSSRGPNTDSFYVMKPDVIAPGVDILAAWTNATSPTQLPDDPRHTEFNVLSGTSMACPHVSGVAALLKGAHRDWSAAMIKSALMTTAYTRDHDGNPLLEGENHNTSTVWDMGAGHVDPEKALDPGLVYDLNYDDYVDFFCASGLTQRQIRVITHKLVKCSGRKPTKPWDLNYPAISVALDASGPSNMEFVVKRTVTHVSNEVSTYTVTIINPKGAIATVEPQKMVFRGKGEKQSYEVRIANEKLVSHGNAETEFGQLTWTDGKHQVTSPILITWKN